MREEGGELMLLELGQVNSLVGTNDETGANKSIKPGQDLITTSLKAEPTVKLVSTLYLLFYVNFDTSQTNKVTMVSYSLKSLFPQFTTLIYTLLSINKLMCMVKFDWFQVL